VSDGRVESHYGTTFEVDCAFKSAGAAVYLERTTTEPAAFPSSVPGEETT
jgi:hypothetical protein